MMKCSFDNIMLQMHNQEKCTYNLWLKNKYKRLAWDES